MTVVEFSSLHVAFMVIRVGKVMANDPPASVKPSAVVKAAKTKCVVQGSRCQIRRMSDHELLLPNEGELCSNSIADVVRTEAWCPSTGRRKCLGLSGSW